MLRKFVSVVKKAIRSPSSNRGVSTRSTAWRRVCLGVELLEQRAVPSVTLENPGNQTNYDGDEVNLALSVTDTTGTKPTFTGDGLPDGLTLNPDTGKITGPLSTTAHTGSVYTTVITAKDGSDSDTQTFSWAVKNPILVINPGTQSNYDGAQVSLPITASDSTNGTLAFSASGLPDGLSIIGNTGVISGMLSSSADTNSPYTTTVYVTDGSYSASETFTWKVHYPVVMASPGNQMNYQGDQVSLPISASDEIGTLNFIAIGLPTGLSIDASTGVIAGTIGIGAASDNPCTTTITASDGTYSASRTVTWTVSHRIVIDSLVMPYNGVEGQEITVSAQATDISGQSVNYTWDFGDGTTVGGVNLGITTSTMRDNSSRQQRAWLY